MKWSNPSYYTSYAWHVAFANTCKVLGYMIWGNTKQIVHHYQKNAHTNVKGHYEDIQTLSKYHAACSVFIALP